LHPNVVGGILAMMLPFTAAVCLQVAKAKNWPAFILGLFLLFPALTGLVLSASRGAWLALIAASALAFLWWVLLILPFPPSKRRQLFVGIFFCTFVILLLVYWLVPEATHALINRTTLLAGGQERLNLFQNSLNLVRDYPFIGAGLGSFMMLYSTYVYFTHVGYIIHAHNIYLDVLIEQGLTGLIPLIWMWVVFAIALWRDAADGRLRPYVGAAALSLVTVLLHGMVEDAIYGSRSLMLLFLPLAFVFPYPTKVEVERYTRSWIARGIILGLLVVAIILWIRPLTSAAVSNLAAILQSQMELGQYSWPEWPIQDAIRREIDLSFAVDGYEQALRVDPTNETANRRLGQLALSLGDYESALHYLEAAFTHNPDDQAIRFLLGEALIVNGRQQEGIEMWSDVNSSQGQFDIRVFWYDYIQDEERHNNLEQAINSSRLREKT
jgi:hypothetical protein